MHFDGGLHPGFDQREGLERVARDEALVTGLDQPVGNVCGIEPEILGVEFLAAAPVTDGGGDKDSAAAHGVEERGGWGGGIHEARWKPKGGLLNPLQWIGYDSRKRPVITYHVYAPCGNSAIYAARFENGAWKRVAAHVWDFRWEFGGGGAIPVPLGSGAVRPAGNGRLALRVWSEGDGSRRVVLDEATLEPLASPEPRAAETSTANTSWRNARSRPEVGFPPRPMRVKWLSDRGRPDDPGIHYLVRWEAGPASTPRRSGKWSRAAGPP